MKRRQVRDSEVRALMESEPESEWMLLDSVKSSMGITPDEFAELLDMTELPVCSLNQREYGWFRGTREQRGDVRRALRFAAEAQQGKRHER